MKKVFLTVFCIFLFFLNPARTVGVSLDSSKTTAFTFHLGISMKPLVNWISRIDSNGSFFTSPVLFEPQITFKKHTLLVGFNYTNQIEKYKVNEIPAELQNLFFMLNPAYYYTVYSRNRWKVMPGFSFGYTKLTKIDELATSLELISETTTTINKIVAPVLRANYRINRIFSIEAEIAYSFIWLDYTYVKNYPLTPSLGRKYDYSYFKTKGSIPSNILFKISF